MKTEINIISENTMVDIEDLKTSDFCLHDGELCIVIQEGNDEHDALLYNFLAKSYKAYVMSTRVNKPNSVLIEVSM